MTDLIERLREVGGMSDDGATRWYINPDGPEAASRIEKLEMLLHGEKCLRQDLKDTAEAHSKQQRDRIEKLESVLVKIGVWNNFEDRYQGTINELIHNALEGKDAPQEPI